MRSSTRSSGDRATQRLNAHPGKACDRIPRGLRERKCVSLEWIAARTLRRKCVSLKWIAARTPRRRGDSASRRRALAAPNYSSFKAVDCSRFSGAIRRHAPVHFIRTGPAEPVQLALCLSLREVAIDASRPEELVDDKHLEYVREENEWEDDATQQGQQAKGPEEEWESKHHHHASEEKDEIVNAYVLVALVHDLPLNLFVRAHHGVHFNGVGKPGRLPDPHIANHCSERIRGEVRLEELPKGLPVAPGRFEVHVEASRQERARRVQLPAPHQEVKEE
eukprot:scaffold142726_cov32-Tisochrysis_lutea.AAC.1